MRHKAFQCVAYWPYLGKQRFRYGSDSGAIMKILIIVHNDTGIGNIVMMTPALAALQQAQPQTEIFIAGNRACPELLSGMGVHYLENIPASMVFDHTFIANVPFSLLTPWLDPIMQATKGYMTAIHYDAANIQHESLMHMKIPEFFGFRGTPPGPWCNVEDVSVPWPASQKAVVLADTSKQGAWQRKRWPYFKELAWVLAKRGYAIVLVGGRAEAEMFDASGWPAHFNLMGQLRLPQLAGVIKKAAFFVGNDSGPAHISGAVGTKTYVLFGSTSVVKNRPLGPCVQVVSSPAHCAPCQFTPQWEACSEVVCMQALTPEMVLKAIFETPECTVSAPPRSAVF